MSHVDPDNEKTYEVCVIKSDHEQTRVPKNAVLGELEKHGYDEQSVFAIKLALEEALANAVNHGNRGDDSKNVIVRYAVTPEKVVILVRDEGPGFVPEDVPDPTHPDRLAIPNGRGIMLMRAYMDSVEFRDDGREVCICKTKCSDYSEQVQRREVYFTGRVQGVGFRMTTQRIAAGFCVAGTVRNLADGRVHLVAEGRPEEIDRFLGAVRQHFDRHITGIDADILKPTGEFHEFRIA